MIKKLFIALILMLPIGTSAFAANTTVQSPTSVGTALDFYHDVKLQWKPVVGAVAYKVYVDKGYNAKTSTLQHTLTNYSLRYINRQYWIVDYALTPDISWYTIKISSIDKYGNESSPCVTNVNVWR